MAYIGKIYRLLRKQGIGGTGVPVVRVGESVHRGTLIVRADGLGADLHASVDGVTVSVSDDAVEIEADAVQRKDFVPLPKPESIVQAVKNAGLVGMGGAGFPTHIKLQTDLKGGAVIVNAAECEPLLQHNIYQLKQEPGLIREGLLYAMQATNAKRGILAVKAKNRDAVAAFDSVIRPGDPLEIAELQDLYPMGEERAVVREILGELLTIDQLPSAAGAVVLNLETVSRIAWAVSVGEPVISKNLTVLGNVGGGRVSRVMMDVPLGTPFRDLLEQAGGINPRWGEIIEGGPFTGKRAQPEGVVTKTTGAVIVTQEFPVEKRPMGLLVCACSADENRLRQLAASMEANVAGVEFCKQAKESRGVLKCENPGNCPGQAEKILKLKKSGAQVLLVSNCCDCTNTVMCVAPKLKMPVYHSTDHVMRTMGHPLIRRLKSV